MTQLPGSWHRARLHHAPASPWRNGGGVTHELAAEPADLWRWRASVARIERDGDFSHFEGVARQFAVVRGAGVHLHLRGQRVPALPRGPAVQFSGEEACRTELVDGPTLDFNLMTRQASAHLQRCTRAQTLAWRSGHIAGLYACEAAQLAHDCGRAEQLAPDEMLWTRSLPEGVWSISGNDALAFFIVIGRP
ncbi:MAG: HutD family protein [Betaproteobacteria bacterium]